MSELTDLIAKERAALDAAIDRAEREFDESELRRCPWCNFAWSTTQGINARAPIWIPEAQHYGHLRCWQQHKEGTR